MCMMPRGKKNPKTNKHPKTPTHPRQANNCPFLFVSLLVISTSAASLTITISELISSSPCRSARPAILICGGRGSPVRPDPPRGSGGSLSRPLLPSFISQRFPPEPQLQTKEQLEIRTHTRLSRLAPRQIGNRPGVAVPVRVPPPAATRRGS